MSNQTVTADAIALLLSIGTDDAPLPVVVNRMSIMLDSLIHAFFKKGGHKSIYALQYVLGADLCKEILTTRPAPPRAAPAITGSAV